MKRRSGEDQSGASLSGQLSSRVRQHRSVSVAITQ